jgi:hypothetical protein
MQVTADRMEYFDKFVKRPPASEEALRLINLEQEFYLSHETKWDILTIALPKFLGCEMNKHVTDKFIYNANIL